MGRKILSTTTDPQRCDAPGRSARHRADLIAALSDDRLAARQAAESGAGAGARNASPERT